jgi:hypothetical protein
MTYVYVCNTLKQLDEGVYMSKGGRSVPGLDNQFYPSRLEQH